MKLYVIFAKRKCRYHGEYAPEALEVMDEFAMESSPEWFSEKMQTHKANSDFENVVAVVLNVSDQKIDDALSVKMPEIQATVLDLP